jgi:hypothetical protein
LAECEWEWRRGEGAGGGDVCEGCMTCGPKRVVRMTTKQIAWDMCRCVLSDGPPGLATVMYQRTICRGQRTLYQCMSWLKLL